MAKPTQEALIADLAHVLAHLPDVTLHNDPAVIAADMLGRMVSVDRALAASSGAPAASGEADNHHNAEACPYCSPARADALARREAATWEAAAKVCEKVNTAYTGGWFAKTLRRAAQQGATT